jgi:hypothetical protein
MERFPPRRLLKDVAIELGGQHDDAALAADLIWGVKAISAFIGIPVRRGYYLIERCAIPVHRLGPRTIVASKGELRRYLSQITSEN